LGGRIVELLMLTTVQAGLTVSNARHAPHIVPVLDALAELLFAPIDALAHHSLRFDGRIEVTIRRLPMADNGRSGAQ
jgi:hypothetical protein